MKPGHDEADFRANQVGDAARARTKDDRRAGEAADIVIGRASFNTAVAIRLLRDRTVRRKVPRQSVGIDFASVDRSRRGVMT
jgi:hypothetical protein